MLLLCFECFRIGSSLTIGSVTWCHSGLCHKCCHMKTSAHQTQWVMTSGDGDRWARDMMMTLSAVWDHKKPHGSENSYQPIPTANCPASSLPKNANWQVVHNQSFETGRWPNSLTNYILVCFTCKIDYILWKNFFFSSHFPTFMQVSESRVSFQHTTCSGFYWSE